MKTTNPNRSLIFGFFIALILVCFAANAQTNTHPNGHDSDVVNAAVNAGIIVGEVITGHKPLIPFLPDEVTGGAISSIIFFFWRIFEKRRLRRQGKLKDQENEPQP